MVSFKFMTEECVPHLKITLYLIVFPYFYSRFMSEHLILHSLLIICVNIKLYLINNLKLMSKNNKGTYLYKLIDNSLLGWKVVKYN